MRKSNFKNEEINKLVDEYNSINEREKYLIDENYNLTTSKDILERYSKNTNDISKIIEDNRLEISQLYTKRNDIRKQMEIIRKSCEHEWEDDGWDSHHNYYICKKCGAECKC